jgi:phage terminase small subunit
MKDKLTAKEEKFVQGLFSGLSQRKAWKQAFPEDASTNETIDNNASKLAKRNEIIARLTELQDEVKEKNVWTIERLIKKFEEIGEKSLDEEEIFDRNGKPTGLLKFDSGGANKAYENIGKLLGFYTEQVKHSGETGVRIIYDIPRRNGKPT